MIKKGCLAHPFFILQIMFELFSGKSCLRYSQKLRGLIAERGLTQSKVAAAMGMSQKTFYSKMKSGQFGLDECEALIDILAISNPMEIFFPHLVS